MKAPTVPRAGSSNAGSWVGCFLDQGAYVALGDGRILVAWGEADAADSPKEEGISFYVPDFFLQEALPWRAFSGYRVALARDMVDLLRGGEPPAIEWEFPEEESFCLSVTRAMDMIARGEIEKAVPTAVLSARGEVSAATRAGLVSGSLRGGVEDCRTVSGGGREG